MISRGELLEARRGAASIQEEIGTDPELVKAQTLIHRKEIVGK